MAAPQIFQSEIHSKTSVVQDETTSASSSITPSSEPKTSKYHPLFNSSETDIILSSSDNLWYRVHSYTLRNTSGFFRAMFSLPQPRRSESSSQSTSGSSVDDHSSASEPFRETEQENPGEPVYILTHETSLILTLFLLLISGKPSPIISSWGSSSCQAELTGTTHPPDEGSAVDPSQQLPLLSCCDVIERVLSLSEMWDAPGPISFIRMGITNPTLLAIEPVRIYAIACHFGWTEARELAAQHTLTLDLLGEEEEQRTEPTNDPINSNSIHSASMTSTSTPTMLTSPIQTSLERLTSKDFLALLNLRKRRVDTFRMLLNSPVRFSAGNTPDYLCARCGVTQLDNRSWRQMKDALMLEIERRPLGDEILGKAVKGLGGTDPVNLGVVSWPEARPCWEAQCTKEGCGGLNYDRVATLRQIAYCIDALPLQVGDIRDS